jgi:hypothetical protein
MEGSVIAGASFIIALGSSVEMRAGRHLGVEGIRCPDASFHHRDESDGCALKQTNEMEADS